MELLVLSAGAVGSVLGYKECADAMRTALIARANGEVFQPLRTVLKPERAGGLMALMPSYHAGQEAGYGLKAICITPGNPARGLDSHQGIVLLSSSQTGEPLAVLNASAVTEIRTAAVSAVATDVLANADADVLAIIGTGVQARAHLRAITSTRAQPLAEIRVAGRTLEKATKFLAELGPEISGRTELIGCAGVRQAVEGAGIIVTATSSAEPVVRREWLTPGVHINAVGACLPTARELDAATVADAALFGDSRESVLAEAGDYVLAAAEGAVGPDHVQAELGELLVGARGRTGEREITIFESLGLAIEDLAAAAVAYQAARDRGLGTWIEFD